MSFTDEQVMLTLAGLTYRGFQDVLSGEPHANAVCREVLDGLRTLSPVRNAWELVWGPVTSRGPRAVFDSSAMYVARHLTDRHRYVVAIRGTNPISLEDWLIGDLWVRTTVPWPWVPPANAVEISASTAVGLATLEQMRSRGVPPPAPPAAAPPGQTAAALAARVEQIAENWRRLITVPLHMVLDRFRSAQAAPPDHDVNLRPKLSAAIEPQDSLDLLSFLRTEADAATRPLEIVVTGHSKGGAWPRPWRSGSRRPWFPGTPGNVGIRAGTPASRAMRSRGPPRATRHSPTGSTRCWARITTTSGT
jgi:hypothetical protein